MQKFSEEAAPEPILGLSDDHDLTQGATSRSARKGALLRGLSRVALVSGAIPVGLMLVFAVVVAGCYLSHHATVVETFMYSRRVAPVGDVVLVVCAGLLAAGFVLGIATWRTKSGKIAIASPFVVALLCFLLRSVIDFASAHG